MFSKASCTRFIDPHRRPTTYWLSRSFTGLVIFGFVSLAVRNLPVAQAGRNADDQSNAVVQSGAPQPQVGPGLPQVGSKASRTVAGSTKAGSLLIFPKFTSDSGRPNQVNTLLTITNTNPRDEINVRVFFIHDCLVEDRMINLFSNQSRTLVAGKEVPGKTGYAIAVAIDSHGLPTQFNWLIGGANLRDGRGHEAGYNAFSVAKRSAGSAGLDGTGRAAEIIFNHTDYDRLPKLVAIDHLQNQDANFASSQATDVMLISPPADLSGLNPNPFKLAATAYDAAGAAYPQDLEVNCSLDDQVAQLWTAPPFRTIIGVNRPGWATFAASGSDQALPVLGLSMTDGVGEPMHSARMMQAIEWLDSFIVTMPVKPPEAMGIDLATQDLPPSARESLGASETKAGSILLFPRFTSGRYGSTHLYLTNTHPTERVKLRLFFSGLAGPQEVKDAIISLPPLQTIELDADKYAPEQRGWIMVAPVDNRALPIEFNHLIGSAQVREVGGQRASFNAVAIAKHNSAPAPRNEELQTTDLLFDDENYDRLPATTAMAFVPSQADNNTVLGFTRLPISLLEPPNTRGTNTVTLYDDASQSFGANLPRTENSLSQVRPSLTQPAITSTLLPGEHGWLKLLSYTPVTSWSLNLSTAGFEAAYTGEWVGGFSGDGNLHILTSAENYSITISAVNPNSNPPVAIAELIGLQIEARRATGTIVRLDGGQSNDRDPDDILTYEWLDNDQPVSAARIADRTLSLGSHSIKLVVTDESGNSSPPDEQTVNVVDTTPPQISGLPSAVTRTSDSDFGEPVDFAIPVAYDMVDGFVAVTASRSPVSVFPLGKSVVTFTARDRAGNSSTATLEVTLTRGVTQPPNGGVAGDKAPYLENLNDQYVRQGEVRMIRLSANDPDDDPVTFDLIDAPPFAQIINGDPGARTAILRISPRAGDPPASLNMRVVANDGRGQTFRTLPFSVIVSEVPNDETGSGMSRNRLPVPLISKLPARIQATSKDGVDISLDASGSSDPDGDPLIYSWFDRETLVARGAVANVTLAVGSHSIRLVAFDGKDGISSAGPMNVEVLPRDLSVSASSPYWFNRPSTVTLTIEGTGFNPATDVRLTKEGIVILNYVSIDEDKIVLTLEVKSYATPGFRDIYLVNPNGRYVRARSAIFVSP